MKQVDIEFVVVVGTFLEHQFDNPNGKNKIKTTQPTT